MLTDTDVGYYRRQIIAAKEIVAPYVDVDDKSSEATLIAAVMIVEAINDLLAGTRGA